MSQLTESLFAIAGSHQILENEPMSRHTTFRVGGPADVLFLPESEEQLIRALSIAREAGVNCVVIGNGSNLVVRDGGIRGLVIALGEGMAAIVRTGDTLTAGAGASLARVSAYAQASGLAGLEFASGIPGTVGGGVYMNAGAYGGELGAAVDEVRIWDGAVIKTVPGRDMAFSYRSTRAMAEKWIILGASFRLQKGDPEKIDAAMRDFAARRKEKQPLNYPSAGSFFKRPEGNFAGALIEKAGLKGKSVGGAQVSEKHAGFLINTGGAAAKDFLQLMELVQKTVQKGSCVLVEPEVRIVGDDP